MFEKEGPTTTTIGPTTTIGQPIKTPTTKVITMILITYLIKIRGVPMSPIIMLIRLFVSYVVKLVIRPRSVGISQFQTIKNPWLIWFKNQILAMVNPKC